MLLQKISQSFSEAVRQRGAEYFVTERMSKLSVDSSYVKSRVNGTHRYSVSIVRVDAHPGWDLEVTCSCPSGGEYGTSCKHIWATLLAAEGEMAKAWGPVPMQVRVVKLDNDDEEARARLEDFDEPDDDDDDDDTDSGDFDDESGHEKPSRSVAPEIHTPPQRGSGPGAVVQVGVGGPMLHLSPRIAKMLRDQGFGLQPAVPGEFHLLTTPAARFKPKPKKPSIPQWERLLMETTEHRMTRDDLAWLLS